MQLAKGDEAACARLALSEAKVLPRGTPRADVPTWSTPTVFEDGERAQVVVLAVTAFCVFMERAQRRIPVQYAKRVRGNNQWYDPDIAWPWPTDVEMILSQKDREAPTLAEGVYWLSARADGGRLLLRVEDVDRTRARRDVEQAVGRRELVIHLQVEGVAAQVDGKGGELARALLVLEPSAIPAADWTALRAPLISAPSSRNSSPPLPSGSAMMPSSRCSQPT